MRQIIKSRKEKTKTGTNKNLKKMNKKLIKELEGVGFEPKDDYLKLEIKDFSFIYTAKKYLQVCTLKDMSPVAPNVHHPTFVDVLTSIKWYTGADLAPKTKRQEIDTLNKEVEALKDCIAELGEEKHRIWERLASFEGIINKQSKVIEMLKCQVPTVATAHQGETILNKKAIKKMQGMCDKQASEMQAEETKGFEVGGSVVIICTPNVRWSKEIKDIISNKTPVIVQRIDCENFLYCIIINNISYWFALYELEHAPAESPKEKALEFGDPLECNVKYDGLLQGEKVIFLSKTKNGNYNVINKHSNHYCLGSIYFKAL